MKVTVVDTAAAHQETVRRRVNWRQRWARLREKLGRLRALRAEATYLKMLDEAGDLESVCWPSVILEDFELTRSEVYQALADLDEENFIFLGASRGGIHAEIVAREQDDPEEDEVS